MATVTATKTKTLSPSDGGVALGHGVLVVGVLERGLVDKNSAACAARSFLISIANI